MRRFVIGDIHGKIIQLNKALEAVDFNDEEDQLITIGDITDRGEDVYGCIERLLKIKNRIDIVGNHDDSWYEGLRNGTQTMLWTQGGKETMASYLSRDIDPKVHIDFFANQVDYHIDEHNNLFVHGGFNRHYPIEGQSRLICCWDRDLWLAALSYESMKDKSHGFKMKDNFNHVFIGHTPTLYHGSTYPMLAANILNIDTGCGKSMTAMLTIMNVDTLEYKQVDNY